MSGPKFSVTKNAFANLVRGGATAAVAIVLPRFLTRSLDADHFSAWSLILQIAAYASYLDFGLQSAVARFIAQAVELEQKERQARLISTAFVLLSLVAVCAFLLVLVLVWLFPHLFHGVSSGMLTDFRKAAVVLSLSACLLLPLSTYTGVLIGMRRNEVPALAIGGSRIVGAAAAIVAARSTQSLTVLALCVGLANLLGGLMQMAAVQALTAEGCAKIRHVNRVIGRELLHFCTGLAVWSLAMLVVSGLDVTIVGHFQFEAVGFYSLAVMLITFFSGLTNAVLSALMAPFSALHARGDKPKILGMLFTAIRLTVVVNCLLTAAVFVWGGPLLRLWVGPTYAAKALPIVEVLAVAQTVRLALTPYAIMLVSVGEQNKNISGAVFEAVTNLGASVVGMMVFGPIGVAWGTLIGAFCAVLWVVLRTMPSVHEVSVQLRTFVLEAVLPGTLPCLPLMLLWAGRRYLMPAVSIWGLWIGAMAGISLAVRAVRRPADGSAQPLRPVEFKQAPPG